MTLIEVTRDRGRTTFSYARGIHYPRPAVCSDGVRCADCLQLLRTYPVKGERRWRHYSRRRAA